MWEGEGGERLDHLEHTPLYKNEQKRRVKQLMETTLVQKFVQKRVFLVIAYRNY